MFAPITKVNEGESNTPCPSTLLNSFCQMPFLNIAIWPKCQQFGNLVKWHLAKQQFGKMENILAKCL
jgi:hypothetical protein